MGRAGIVCVVNGREQHGVDACLRDRGLRRARTAGTARDLALNAWYEPMGAN